MDPHQDAPGRLPRASHRVETARSSSRRRPEAGPGPGPSPGGLGGRELALAGLAAVLLSGLAPVLLLALVPAGASAVRVSGRPASDDAILPAISGSSRARSGAGSSVGGDPPQPAAGAAATLPPPVAPPEPSRPADVRSRVADAAEVTRAPVAVRGDDRQPGGAGSVPRDEPGSRVGEAATRPANRLSTLGRRPASAQPDGEAERPPVRSPGVPSAVTASAAAPVAEGPVVRAPLGRVDVAGDPDAPAAVDTTKLADGTVAPPPMPHRGVLTASSGKPLVGPVSAIFALYEGPSGGVPEWVAIKTVQAGADGAYTVTLGEHTEFPGDLFAADAVRWLGVQPDGETEQPRVRFPAVPAGLTSGEVVPHGGLSPAASAPRGAVTGGREPTAPAVADVTTPVADVSTSVADVTTPVATGFPQTPIPYRGILTDATGQPRVGPVNAIFALYDQPVGGVPLWVAIKTAQAGADGDYAVLLGDTNPLPPDLFATGEGRWLGVQPDGETERPRVRLTGAPAPPAAALLPVDPRLPLVCPPSGMVGDVGVVAVRWAADSGGAGAAAHATPPPLIPYRGVLTTAAGAPRVGGVSTIFAIYAGPSGGVPFWVAVRTVQAGAAGGYTVLLGAINQLPMDLFATDEARWLGVQPDGQDEYPRVRIGARSVDPQRCRVPDLPPAVEVRAARRQPPRR